MKHILMPVYLWHIMFRATQDLIRKLEAIWAVEQTSEISFFQYFQQELKTRKDIYNLWNKPIVGQ